MARARLTYNASDVERTPWLPGWAHHIALDGKFTVLFPTLLTLMCIAAAFFAPPPQRDAPRAHGSWADGVLLAACGAALAIWWLEAPSPRFGMSYFWIAATSALLVVIEGPHWRWSARVAALMSAAVLLAALFLGAPIPPADRLQIVVLFAGAFGWLMLVSSGRWRERAALAVALLVLALAEPAGRFIAALTRHRVADAIDIVWLVPDHYYTNGVTIDPDLARQTFSGLTVYLAARAQYETALPNTRYFNPYLELRRPGTLAHGFRARLPPDLVGPGYSMDYSANRRVDQKTDSNARR
jgi:hypothetical protein